MIDPVLDWDNRSGTADVAFADRILAAAAEEGVAIDWVLETHAHADHLTAAPYIKSRTGAPIGIGEHIRDVQAIFRPVFQAEDVKPDGGGFDRLFRDGERFPLGSLEMEVIHTPSDTLFMHDYGTARADVPGGDARVLFRSMKKIRALPPQTRLWMPNADKAPGATHTPGNRPPHSSARTARV